MKYLGIDSSRPRVAVFDLTGCEGCQLQLANREETLLAFLAAVDIVEVTSPGGITAWLVQEESIPFVALEIRFQGGSALDLPGKRGAVNLMTAGRGIVHSERTPDELATKEHALHGVQTWMALPDHLQEIDPAFAHYAEDELPVIEDAGVTTTVIIGSVRGERSPVTAYADTIYLDQQIAAGASAVLPGDIAERGIFVIAGEITVGDQLVSAGTMAVLRPTKATLTANRPSHVLIVGGEAIGPRHIWWNFVSTSKERIEQAKEDWTNGRFGKIPGETEFIPLPD